MFWTIFYNNMGNITVPFNKPLEKGVSLHLNKLEFRSPMNALCQVWLKLAQWFWRTRALNFAISLLSNRRYSSFK